MKIKLLLLFISAAFILQSCKKNEVTPTNNNNTPVAPVPKIFSVANIFQSNMVVQRDKPFTIWGTGSTATKILVNVSWNAGPFYATTDNAGNWKITIPAAAVNSNAQTISVGVDGKDPVILTNVLIGDVWICSGQSNMVMPVDAIAPFTGVVNYQQEIANANYPQIRAFTLPASSQQFTLTDLVNTSKWDICSSATVGQVSGVGYFFARKLNTDLNIPIGIIIAAVNNTNCQQWMNNEAFEPDPSVLSEYANGGGEYYNGMISPLTGLSVKGFIWYQGENNAHDDPGTYASYNATLIKGWRTVFKQGALPFYYVQMPAFDESGTGNITLNDFARFREAQATIRNLVPNSGMAVTIDVGNVSNHHPQNKKPVGERLALLALKNDYGKTVIANGPTYSSYTVSNNVATLNFVSGTADGLTTAGNAAINQYFFVAGPDQIFRQGTAVISGKQVIVTAQIGTPLPLLAVRYAFSNFPITNLQNAAGLPMEPFRTDNWDN